MSDWLLAVHCGAGRYGSSSEAAYLSLLRSALESAHQVIARSSSPTAAQIAAHLLQAFEHSTLTNAGLGANLTEEGRVECEASVVCGQTHLVSCCGAVTGVKEPSALALKLLEQAKSDDSTATFAFGRQPPLVVVGGNTQQLARDFGLETAVDEELEKYQVTEKTREHWTKWHRRFQEVAETKEEEQLDTVGAIYVSTKAATEFATCVDAVQTAASMGRLDILKFFEEVKIPARGKAMRDEINTDRGHVARWDVETCVLVTAVHNGAIVAIVLLEWLRAKYRTHGFDPVSEDENYEVGGEETKEESSDLSEEDENVTGISDYQAENTIIAAIGRGNFKFVKWLYESFSPHIDLFDTTQLSEWEKKKFSIDTVAQRGDLVLIKYLHEIAANRGHLDVVKGHLEMVKWLHV
ncbi:hypothetical protein JG688_00013843 [Phytophthora aleatoria]|uniref:Uncharacterized protein n=1 Tax=Phytophthora aleatoria TaxID=2496075 RepID=A0A8J5ICV2_9STRA|nr:hypothetical protein JG688_00013843 [Phytophthora aleatoria]